MSNQFTNQLTSPNLSALSTDLQPLDIPSAHLQETDPQNADEPNFCAVVGSPENVSSLPSQSLSGYFTPQQAVTPSQSGFTSESPLSSGTLRPSYLRSVTSPPIPYSATSLSTTNRARIDATGGAPIPSRVTNRDRRRARGHEWTVFGELMGTTGEDSDDRRRQSRSITSAVLRPGARESLRDFVIGRSSQSPGRRTTIAHSAPSSPAYELRTSTLSMTDEPDGRESTIHGTEASSDIPDDESDMGSVHTAILQQQPSGSRSSWIPSLPNLSPLHRSILKCCVAYFIASLFTYVPYLSGFIADIKGGDEAERMPSPSGHMVATVAVYFNPAKTIGGMLEADKFCLMGLLYAAFISLGSMSMYWFFEVRAGWEWLADCLVILWIGLGMSGLAYMKLWMAKPTFNTACSMTSIILFVVVVKEGGLETLLEVSFIVIVGALVSNLVCAILWPQRATRNLQKTMSQTLDSFSTLLIMITETFLLEETLILISQEKLDKATKDHQGSFTKLKKDLGEAQNEWLVGGPGKPTTIFSTSKPGLVDSSASRGNLGQAYEDAVDSINRLGQHLNGLRSGISVQYELVRASRDGKLRLKNRQKRARANSSLTSNGNGKAADNDAEEEALLQAAADSFGDLVEDLGPPLKALSTTCSNSIKRLRDVFNERENSRNATEISPEELPDLAEALERALFTFESTSNHAVVRLYRRGMGSPSISRRSESFQSSLDDTSVLVGADSESIFLVYFFFFTLQEFTRELVSLVDAIRRVNRIQKASSWQHFWKESLSYPWRSVRSRIGGRKQASTIRGRNNASLRNRLSALFSSEHTPKRVAFPKVKPHAPNTKQTPAREELPFMHRLGQMIWTIGDRLKENDCKFAIKAGMATAMLAAPAFFEATRPIFTEYRGEWALISFFVVISPTIGATNYLGLHRVFGTILGAATAVGIWTAFPGDHYVLPIFGFFFAIPCFYYIVARPELAAAARFVLLTYNLTCLYCYNIRQRDISVLDIAVHRATAVTLGVVWAAIVSRFWWPVEARRELGKALGEFCLNMGWLYTRLVAFNSWENNTAPFSGHVNQPSPGPSEHTALLLDSTNTHLNDSIIEFMAMELHLQIKLIELQGLLAQTQHEPRLKGPFPVKLYRSMLTSLQTILDKLHSMRCVTSREEWHTTVRRDFIVPTNVPRREMVGNVILYFSVLASAFRLKSPLPPYLPPAENARQRLVDAIRMLDVVKNRDVKGSRQLLFFAYALTMRGVIQELDYLGRTLQDTFGVIGESTSAFEALFQDAAYETV